MRNLIVDQAKYGFVAFSDPEDFLRAWKEMDGTSTLDCLELLTLTHVLVQANTSETVP
jgi:hypothetical protein